MLDCVVREEHVTDAGVAIVIGGVVGLHGGQDSGDCHGGAHRITPQGRMKTQYRTERVVSFERERVDQLMSLDDYRGNYGSPRIVSIRVSVAVEIYKKTNASSTLNNA